MTCGRTATSDGFRPDTKAAAQLRKESSSFRQRSRCSTPNRLASLLKSRPPARSAPIWSARSMIRLSVVISSSLKSSATGSQAAAFPTQAAASGSVR